MDSNNVKELANIISNINDGDEVLALLNELLTEAEVDDLDKRWRILKMLSDGSTQREVASKLKVGLCKVTRGAKILKMQASVVKKYLK